MSDTQPTKITPRGWKAFQSKVLPFFNSNVALRNKGFLWANDLSQYDSVFHIPFNLLKARDDAATHQRNQQGFISGANGRIRYKNVFTWPGAGR